MAVVVEALTMMGGGGDEGWLDYVVVGCVCEGSEIDV